MKTSHLHHKPPKQQWNQQMFSITTYQTSLFSQKLPLPSFSHLILTNQSLRKLTKTNNHASLSTTTACSFRVYAIIALEKQDTTTELTTTVTYLEELQHKLTAEKIKLARRYEELLRESYQAPPTTALAKPEKLATPSPSHVLSLPVRDTYKCCILSQASTQAIQRFSTEERQKLNVTC